MAEYVKGVGRSEDDSSAQPKAESSYMGVDDADEAPAQPAAEAKHEAAGAGKFGAWVSAEGDEADADEDADMADAEEEQEVDKDEALIHEKAIGRGQAPSEKSCAHRVATRVCTRELMTPPTLSIVRQDAYALRLLLMGTVTKSHVHCHLIITSTQRLIKQRCMPPLHYHSTSDCGVKVFCLRHAVCVQALAQPWSC